MPWTHPGTGQEFLTYPELWEAYGCSSIIKALFSLVAVIAVFAMIIFAVVFLIGIFAPSTLTSLATTPTATPNAQLANANATRQAQANDAVSRLKQQGTKRINNRTEWTFGTTQYYILIDRVEFTDNIKVFVESNNRLDYDDARNACILWQGQVSNGASKFAANWVSKLPESFQIDRRDDGFKGYVVYPYSIVTQGVSYFNAITTYYFRMGCSGSYSQVPIFEVGQ